jgi:hypothetical protein
MPKMMLHDDEARKALGRGVAKLAKAVATLIAALYLRPGAASSSRATSSWLRTIGALRGSFTSLRGRTRSGRSSVTVKKNRSAAMAAWIDQGLTCCCAIAVESGEDRRSSPCPATGRGRPQRS